jgi:hypothetical protein
MEARKCAVIVEAAKTIDFKHEYVSHFTRDHVRSKFAAVNKDFLELFMETVILTGEEFKLPCFMGSLQLVKRRVRNKTNRTVDWVTTKKLYGNHIPKNTLTRKQIVYFEDTLLKGFNVKLYWSKSKFQSSFKTKRLYSLTMSRSWFRDSSNKNLKKRFTVVQCLKSEGAVGRYRTLNNYTIQSI